FPPGDELIRYGEISEDVGFDHFWANDHLSWPHPLVDPIALLSSIAARTSSIALATAVYLLPLRAPAAVARSFASLDYISGGRVILGVGVGGEFAEDFSGAGVPSERRGGRTNVMIDLLHRFWAGEPVTYRDEFFDIKDVLVLPRPVQRDIPIVVGGRSDAALKRA